MITQSDIGEGDRLGAQMSSLACLLWLGWKTGHKVVFHSEVRNASQGLLFLDVFDLPDLLLPESRTGLIHAIFAMTHPAMCCFWTTAETKMKRIRKKSAFILTRLAYRLLRFTHRHEFIVPQMPWGPRVHCDDTLLSLLLSDKSSNFDIRNGRLGSYQDWKTHENEIISFFRFKTNIVNAANKRLIELQASLAPAPKGSPKATVAVHFRRTDYLMVSSLNLTEKYYREALSHFPPERFVFFVFSDDIESCRNMPLFSDRDVVYIDTCSAGEGMCLMSLCDHAIIANSSFSFWGAMLNRNPDKQVVCPREFGGKGFPANGLWYPDNWISYPVLQ